jgi:hypothetical protein
LPRPTFENCTIRNCFAKGGHGGNGGDAGFNFGDPCGYGGLTTVVKAGQGNIINDNSARGGGVFIGQNCNAKFINCTITDNATEGSISGVGGYSYWETQQQPKKNYHLPSFGAGVFCDKKSTVKFSKCNLQNNKTISTNAGETIPSDDSDFSGGAGVGLWFVSSAEVNDCNFTLNSAPIGGGIYGFWTDVNVVDCNISYNNSFSGGGIYALNSSVEIRKSLVKGNNAGTQSDSNQNQYAGYPLFGSGGGVYALASMIDINDTTITENSATATGGGVCIDGWPTPETHKPLIKNCLITNNTAVTSGGGIASIILADLQIQNCTIANNIVSGATGSGGGLYGSFESDTIVKDSIIWGNTSVNGSQIALSNGQSDMPASLNITYSDIQTSGQDANIVLDVVICVDTTGSMYNVIESIKNAASNIVDKIAESTSAYRIAVVDFRNYEVYVPGLNYAYKDEIAFSSDKAVILQAINNLTAVLGTGSLNGRTSGYAALTHCIDGASLGDWRTAKNTKKIIIYMSDAAPDDPDPFFGYNLQTVTGAANSKNVNIYTILTGYGVVDTISQLRMLLFRQLMWQHSHLHIFTSTTRCVQ